jgi:hypothetical protein
MKTLIGPIVALWVICSISAVSLASGETVDLGLAKISIDLESLGSYSVEEGSHSSMDHHEREASFKYTIYPATVNFDGTSNQAFFEVHQLSAPQSLETSISRKGSSVGLEHCVEQSNVIAVLMELQTNPYQINGRDGLLSTVSEDRKDPLYLAAFSHD